MGGGGGGTVYNLSLPDFIQVSSKLGFLKQNKRCTESSQSFLDHNTNDGADDDDDDDDDDDLHDANDFSR